MSAPHILVVDDDAKIRTLLRRCFEGEGFRVSEADSGRAVEAELDRGRPDLVTLDLNLPDMDGLSIARAIRARSDVPIVMVTGKGDMIDRVVGLELGADDYIAKPFHVREVIARIRAVLRRSEQRAAMAPAAAPAAVAGVLTDGPQRLRFDRWVLDPAKRELRDGEGRLCPLTTAEFGLLEVLVRNSGRVLSRDRLMDLLKGHDWTPLDRSIDNMVSKLRKKIEAEPGEPTLLKTVRGIGYLLAADVEVIG